MQTYASRNDDQAIASVLADILSQINDAKSASFDFTPTIKSLEILGESDSKDISIRIERLIPRLRKLVHEVATKKDPLTIFLDDFHVLANDFQPRMLSAIYSISRGNNAFIKLSGIEQFTKTWDENTRTGLQPPHDAQILNLDYNLTMPDKSKVHIVSILNAHAIYCGLPSISYLASDEVLSRVVLEAAAVPRDALNLFTQAINKAHTKGQKAVSLISVNAAASEMAEEKLKDIEKDTNEDQKDITETLEKIKAFCIVKQRKNSFLIRIKNSDPTFQFVRKLIALRLVHVLHEGITPHEAGQRYMALMLDYGFYIGIRAARSVVLFPTEPRPLLAKDLRKLPIFS